MYNDLNGVYKALLECHLANLYSFYFKLFKYEKLVKANMNRDITSIVNDTIGVVNEAIHTGEDVYHVVGNMPELSVSFLKKHSIINHKIKESSKSDDLLQAIKEDQNSIEKTLALTIYYSDTLKLQDESVHLTTTHSEIGHAFEKLEVVFQ